MKILDPISGLRQITSGKFFFPRRIALNGIRSKDISVTELGYFLIALTSTDWDKGKYRFGIIRHEPKRLAEIWSIPYPTLLQNFNSLVKKGLLSKQGGSFQITDFSEFQKATGKYSNNNTTTDEELVNIFGKSFLESEKSDNDSEISYSYQSTTSVRYRVSNKVEDNEEVEATGKSLLRADADYQRIYLEGNYQYLVPEDMRWLDEHFSANGRYVP